MALTRAALESMLTDAKSAQATRKASATAAKGKVTQAQHDLANKEDRLNKITRTVVALEAALAVITSDDDLAP